MPQLLCGYEQKKINKFSSRHGGSFFGIVYRFSNSESLPRISSKHDAQHSLVTQMLPGERPRWTKQKPVLQIVLKTCKHMQTPGIPRF